MNEVLTADEVAEQFFNGKLSYDTVLKMAKSEQIPCKKLGRQYFFSLDVLNAWMHSGQKPA